MLRPYQQKAIEEIREHYRKGTKRVLLHLLTGAGKTKTFCEMLKRAYERKTPSLLVVHMNQLIRQAEDRLTEDGVPHGVIQGNRTRDEFEYVRVCSIQTLYRRKLILPASFIVIDEAHVTDNEQYRWLLSNYPDAFILAVTATPHLKRGMRHVADAVVKTIDPQGLIDGGFIVPARYFATKNKVDLSDVKIVRGDYHQNQLGEKMSAVVGDVVENYRKFADGLPALAFAVNVKHSKSIADTFNSAGISCKHIDADTPYDERTTAIAQLTSGELKIISSVGTLTTGFDCPPARALIVCRPTKSYNLHIQILGRGSRPYLGKENFIVIDHAGNTLRHGFYETDRDCDLDGDKKKSKGSAASFLTECESCLAIFHISKKFCPSCGAENHKKPQKKEIKHISGELQEITLKKLQDLKMDHWIEKAKKYGHEKGWIYHQVKEKYGSDYASMIYRKLKVIADWPTKKSHPEMFTRTRGSLTKFF